jgi:diguanylate cyclase (GGDEF)-like protein
VAGDHPRTGGEADAPSETPGQETHHPDHVVDIRDQRSDSREREAEARDARAEARDARAEARDDRSEVRDDRAELREQAAGRTDAGSASDRDEALQDRHEAARDRADAARDRGAALSDRVTSALERAVSSIDALTGAHRRDPGIVELERETAKAMRTQHPFVVAFVDVDGLKATNDSLGHEAGDRLLCQVADAIRANLRPYDLIVRFGGDEFVCGISDLYLDAAAKRFVLVNERLARTGNSVTIGLAELQNGDSLEALIRRADEALYQQRQEHPSRRS